MALDNREREWVSMLMSRVDTTRYALYVPLCIAVSWIAGCDLNWNGCTRLASVHKDRNDLVRLHSIVVGTAPAGMPERLNAARSLATRPDGEAWVCNVILWSVTDRDDLGETLGDRTPKAVKRGIVAVMLSSCEFNASPAVLVSLTYLLSEEKCGRWSEKRWMGLFWRLSEHKSSPLREVAREILVKQTGKDYGFDAPAWRQELLVQAGG